MHVRTKLKIVVAIFADVICIASYYSQERKPFYAGSNSYRESFFEVLDDVED